MRPVKGYSDHKSFDPHLDINLDDDLDLDDVVHHQIEKAADAHKRTRGSKGWQIGLTATGTVLGVASLCVPVILLIGGAASFAFPPLAIGLAIGAGAFTAISLLVGAHSTIVRKDDISDLLLNQAKGLGIGLLISAAIIFCLLVICAACSGGSNMGSSGFSPGPSVRWGGGLHGFGGGFLYGYALGGLGRPSRPVNLSFNTSDTSNAKVNASTPHKVDEELSESFQLPPSVLEAIDYNTQNTLNRYNAYIEDSEVSRSALSALSKEVGSNFPTLENPEPDEIEAFENQMHKKATKYAKKYEFKKAKNAMLHTLEQKISHNIPLKESEVHSTVSLLMSTAKISSSSTRKREDASEAVEISKYLLCQLIQEKTTKKQNPLPELLMLYNVEKDPTARGELRKEIGNILTSFKNCDEMELTSEQLHSIKETQEYLEKAA